MAVNKVVYGSNTLIDLTDTTATASDVAQGKYFYTADGTRTAGTASGGGGAFTVTATFSNGEWSTLDKTFAQIQSAYNNGETIVVSAYDTYGDMECQTSCYYDSENNTFVYTVAWFDYQDTGHQFVDTYFYTSTECVLDDRQEYGSPTTLVQKTITANGTYNPILTDYADGYSLVTVNVPSSGGASNFVTGTFTGTDAQKGTALSITLPYTGSGYPIAVVICPTEGAYNSSSGSFYNLVQRYAIAQYAMTKSRINTAPSYGTSGANNQGVVTLVYKSSTSNVTSYGRAGTMSSNVYSSNSAMSTNTLTVRFTSNTNLSVFIASDNNYGFAADIEYTYWIVYSE